MTISYFITGFRHRTPATGLSEDQQLALGNVLTGIEGLDCAEIGVPAEVQTYHADAPVPALTLRLDFATLPRLERELAGGGGLQALATSPLWSSLALDEVSQQAMLRRCFLDQAQGERGCAYQVHYPGQAEDLNAWLRHYLSYHAVIMKDYPRVRGVDVFTRVDWCDSMPWPRVAHMQRNRIGFDSAQDLLVALESPVRERMRRDHDRFPAYSQGSRHYPMRVTRLRLRSA